MSNCDYLIMSNSGLSTLIGYMSTNSKKYYHPNPHCPQTLPSPEFNPRFYSLADCDSDSDSVSDFSNADIFDII